MLLHSYHVDFLFCLSVKCDGARHTRKWTQKFHRTATESASDT